MNKINIRNILANASFHASILINGLARTLYGALIAGLIGVSVYGFVSIRSETGYIAVFDFIAAIATLVVALCNMYCIGKKKGRGKK